MASIEGEHVPEVTFSDDGRLLGRSLGEIEAVWELRWTLLTAWVCL